MSVGMERLFELEQKDAVDQVSRFGEARQSLNQRLRCTGIES